MKVLSSTCAILVLAAGSALAASTASGHWEGKITLPNREFPIAVDLSANDKGAWIGSISVGGTTSAEVPLNGIEVKEASVTFSATLPTPATFEGKLSADGNALSGMVRSPQGEAPFELKRSGDANVKLPPASSALPKEFEGSWQGSLEAGGNVLRVGLKLASTPDGKATATLVSLDQGNQEFPVATVTAKGKELQLDVRAVSGTYKGTLGENGEISGQWTQGPGSVPLTFKRAAK